MNALINIVNKKITNKSDELFDSWINSKFLSWDGKESISHR